MTFATYGFSWSSAGTGLRYASENKIASGERLHFTGRHMKFCYRRYWIVLVGLLTTPCDPREIDGTIIRATGLFTRNGRNR